MKTKHRGKGRPKGSGIPGAKVVLLYLGDEHTKVLDQWRTERKLRTRSAALRDILERLV